MTFEEFRNLAQGLQAIFLSIGAIIASGWAIYTFHSLLSKAKAKAELDKINAEIEKSKLELDRILADNRATPILSVDIEPSMLGSLETAPYSFKVELRVKNIGNTNEYIDWGVSSVKAALVKEFKNGKVLYSEPIEGSLGAIGVQALGATLFPGETVLEELLFPIEKSGVYLIHADIYVSKASTEEVSTSIQTLGNSSAFGMKVYFDTRANKLAGQEFAEPNKANTADAKSRAAD